MCDNSSVCIHTHTKKYIVCTWSILFSIHNRRLHTTLSQQNFIQQAYSNRKSIVLYKFIQWEKALLNLSLCGLVHLYISVLMTIAQIHPWKPGTPLLFGDHCTLFSRHLFLLTTIEPYCLRMLKDQKKKHKFGTSIILSNNQ